MKLKILLSWQRWWEELGPMGAGEVVGRAVGEGCGLDVLVVVGGLTGIQPTLVGNSHGSERPDQPHRPGVPRVPTGSFLGISPTLPQASSWVTQTLRAAQEERRKALTCRPKQPELF